MFATGSSAKEKNKKLDDIDDAIYRAQMPDTVNRDFLLFFFSSRHMLAGTGSQPLFMMEGALRYARWRAEEEQDTRNPTRILALTSLATEEKANTASIELYYSRKKVPGLLPYPVPQMVSMTPLELSFRCGSVFSTFWNPRRQNKIEPLPHHTHLHPPPKRMAPPVMTSLLLMSPSPISDLGSV